MSALDSIETRLVFTDEQAHLREEARRWLAARSSMEAVRSLLTDRGGDDPAAWRELGAMGWLGIVTPQAHGGAGLGAVELAVLAEETGRALLATPLLGHVLASMVIGIGGSEAQRASWLPRLASGEIRAAWAHVEPDGAWRAAETTTRLEGGRLRGAKSFVTAADSADLFCVPVAGGAHVRIILVRRDADGVRVEAEEVLDRTRRQGRLFLEDVTVESDALLERAAVEVEESLLPLAWTAIAAEAVGGADAALAMTAAYAAEREQFGKAIGSFQAIKHPLVNVLIATEQARSLVYAAACAIAQTSADAVLLSHMARAAAAEAYGFATSRAIQFHGGFGFTEECDAHLYRRRALASRSAFGGPDYHRTRVADLVLGRV